MADLIITLTILAAMLAAGYIVGSIEQADHYRSITKREKQYSDILLFNEKRIPSQYAGQDFLLVCGSVVMGSDYFRQLVASLKALIGGRLTSFEAMIDRGRREAILRMKEDAHSKGATVIFNVRFETSNLSYKSGKRGGLACVELVVYGTACRLPAAKNYA